MSPGPQSALTTDSDSFASALDAGELDRCLRLLRTGSQTGPDEVERNCRLAEALFHGGRRAFALAGGHAHILDFCAWLFSNGGAYAEAAEAYRGLLAAQPDWVEGYRHASGALAAVGLVEEAIGCAVRASSLAPENHEFAIHAAELLQRVGRFDEAATLLRQSAAAGAANAAVLRVLSGIEMLQGRIEKAIAAIEQAITLSPGEPEYHLHHAHLLLRRHDFAAAQQALAAATAMAPSDPAIRRAEVELLAGQGRLAAAPRWPALC